MTTDPKQSKGRDSTLSALNMAIKGLNPSKETSTIAPAKAVFGSANVLLTTIRVCSLLVFCGHEIPNHPFPGLYGQ